VAHVRDAANVPRTDVQVRHRSLQTPVLALQILQMSRLICDLLLILRPVPDPNIRAGLVSGGHVRLRDEVRESLLVGDQPSSQPV
jgi:hypothetical protein